MNTLNPTNEALLSERVRALEKLNSQLAAEVDRQRPVVEIIIQVKHRGRLPDSLADVAVAIAVYEASAPK